MSARRPSLRRRLLAFLALPMLALLLLNAVITYRVALAYSNHMHDRNLLEDTQSFARALRLPEGRLQLLFLGSLAVAVEVNAGKEVLPVASSRLSFDVRRVAALHGAGQRGQSGVGAAQLIQHGALQANFGLYDFLPEPLS